MKNFCAGLVGMNPPLALFIHCNGRSAQMRRIVAASFVSLDGVSQSPGGPQEDPRGGFRFGGWVFTYADEQFGAVMDGLFSRPYELLLGRRTYDIFAAYWPHHADIAPGAEFNRTRKYVTTHEPQSLAWNNTEWLGEDPVSRLREIRRGDGPILLTQGSAELVHTLLANDLVDELHVMTFPVVLGSGIRFFDGGAMPRSFRLTACRSTPSGVVAASYEKVGEVETGSFPDDVPSPEELERQRRLGA
jgi:dihydrofolate reductase